MLRERESTDSFHGLWGVQVDPHTTPHPPSLHSFPQRARCPLYQWQYCTSYRMIYFLYEVNCCFLSILLHKYLILCFFTSYSGEIIIRKKFWSHPAAKWIGSWLFLLLLSILMAACLRQIDMSHAKEWVLRRTQFGNVYILGVNNNASTSFFTLFHSI